MSTPATMTSGPLGPSAGAEVGLAAATGEREGDAALGLAGAELALAVAVGVTVRDAVGEGVGLALAAGVALAAAVGDGDGDEVAPPLSETQAFVSCVPTNAQTLRVEVSQLEPSAAVRETAARMNG